ncbi:hypothetical protein JTE90_001782 [Oedothorax gibbosus]|uniref:Uncharacterized protein n=1 Tax=Oedothorax gibbosus TaxID=931172 RepID=A0AAV6VQH2_9ARAC|nr:hypothetical protein JTE90_001782 [Oedothorax gibbosus]
MVFPATCFGALPSTVETVKKCLAIFLDDNCDYGKEWGTEKEKFIQNVKALDVCLQGRHCWKFGGGAGMGQAQHGTGTLWWCDA